MNDVHFHLIVNHFPIIFPIVGTLILALGLFLHSDVTKRIAYLLYVLGGIASIAAMSTGEGAEDIVEKLVADSDSYIERHEEASEVFAILSYLLGFLSLVGIWVSFRIKSLDKSISIFVIAFALVTLFFAQKAGTSGGEIRHTEIRKESAFNAKYPKSPEKSYDD